jgi:hypothetical protein
MEENIHSKLCDQGLIKLLKDFTKGCISENIEAKAEIKPLSKSIKNPDNILNEMKYVKSSIK